jgi:type IV secretion system protein TrbI
MEESIKDRAPKPSGLLPKNLQAFVLIGLSLAMVLIMAITGQKRPAAKTRDDKLRTPPSSPVNSSKVLDFEKGIEQSQRESAPQAEAALLEQQRLLAAQGKWPGQPVLPAVYSNPVPADSSSRAYPAWGNGALGPQAGASQGSTDAIREETRKRHYLSYFADNVAISFRKDGLGVSSKPATFAVPGFESSMPQGSSQSTNGPVAEADPTLSAIGPQLAREEQLLQQMQQVALSSSPSNPRPSGATTLNSARTERDALAESPRQEPKGTNAGPAASPTSAATPNATTGKTFVILEGTILEALLINRLDGTFAGPVNCLLSDNIYSHDRQHVLIPAGSKILGVARKVDTLGQTRLAIAFHRLLMPDGYSVNLDQFQGMDQQGATAVKDKVNHHYATIFGASLALGVLGGVAQIGTGSALTSTGTERIQEGFGVGMANAGEEILNRFLNILPTVTIREGTRIKIYLSNDLLLPDYTSHTIASDI